MAMVKELRPFGVTVLAALEALSAFLTFGLGVVLLGGIEFRLYYGMHPFLRVLAAFVDVASIVLALLNGDLAWGLWTGKG